MTKFFDLVSTTDVIFAYYTYFFDDTNTYYCIYMVQRALIKNEIEYPFKKEPV